MFLGEVADCFRGFAILSLEGEEEEGGRERRERDEMGEGDEMGRIEREGVRGGEKGRIRKAREETYSVDSVISESPSPAALWHL